jgi:polyphosphate kinase
MNEEAPMDDSTAADAAWQRTVFPPKPNGTVPVGSTEVIRNETSTPPNATPVPLPLASGSWDLDDPDLYLNRELTWLNFNYRVLAMADDPRTPLLERLKFAAIVGSNLDEFFMKRIGGLKQQVGAGVLEPSLDGRTSQQQIAACYEVVHDLEQRKSDTVKELRDALEEAGVLLTNHDDLTDDDKAYLRELYIHSIYPVVTPQATDPAHPFPFVSNLSLNLLVSLRYPGDPESSLARVKVPVGPGVPRLVRFPDRALFVPVEQIMEANLDLLFPGMQIDGCELFRVTRNADTQLEEDEADDLLAMIETELRQRKLAPIVRLETVRGMASEHRGMLAAELGLDEDSDVFEVDGFIGHSDLMEVLQVERPDLCDEVHHPVDHPALVNDRPIFHTIREAGSLFVAHPYESFTTSVERLLREASQDPKVRAIKMTLYRTSADTKAVDYLIDAARNGKEVAVVVELKAKFDEAANIRWASRLNEVGIHVTYGVVGLKTHCKAILVVRQDFDGFRRYAHVGTGNYHAGTSRLYSDFGLLTCDEDIGRDLTELFNYLTTGYKPKRNFLKILPAPKVLKLALLDRIEREIAVCESGERGHIIFKANALEDPEISEALYRASRAGVNIDLIIRDTCRIRPGLPGLSETIRVISVVGRFLEHGRAFYFRNGGDEEYYIGSADMMGRNLNSRVELVAPIEDPALRAELRYFLDVQLQDQRSAWEMRADGSYVQRQPSDPDIQISSHETAIRWADDAHREATRLRKRKPKQLGKLR